MIHAKRTGNGTKYNVQISRINLALQVIRVLLIISMIWSIEVSFLIQKLVGRWNRIIQSNEHNRWRKIDWYSRHCAKLTLLFK